MSKTISALIIAAAYIGLVLAGTFLLLDFEPLVKAQIIGGVAIVTMAISLIFLQDMILKKHLFLAGILLINIGFGYGWSFLPGLWKMIGYSLWLIELLYILNKAYKKFGGRLNLPSKPKSYRYVARPSATFGSSAEVNINQFCKSKYHTKQEVDECQARMLQE